MAITNAALVSTAGNAPGDPLFMKRVTLDLDNNYLTGGYTGFKATLDAISDGKLQNKTIVAIVTLGIVIAPVPSEPTAPAPAIVTAGIVIAPVPV